MVAGTTGVGLLIVDTGTTMTTGSLISVTTAGAGAYATNGAISLTSTGAFTSTTAVNGGFVEVKANSTTAGTIVNVVGSALTTGIGLQLSNGTSAMTSGSMIRVTISGTGTVATNGLVAITHAGIFTSTSNAGVLNVSASAAVGAATLVNIAATAGSQTAVNLLNLVQSGASLTAYTGNLVSITGGFSGGSSTGNCLAITSVNTAAGSAIAITSNSTTSSTAGVVAISATALTSGVGMLITGSGTGVFLTAGALLSINASTATVGAAIKVASTGTYTDAVSALVNITASGASTGNVLAVITPSSSAFAVGLAVATPAFSVDCSTAIQAAGLNIKGAIAAGVVAATVTSSGGNASLTIDGKGTGTIGINTVSTTSGLVTIGNSTSLAGLFVNGAINGSVRVLPSSGNTSPTVAQTASTILFDAATGVTFTLPAPVAGLTYTFTVSVSVTSNNHKIVTSNTGSIFIIGTLAMGEVTLGSTSSASSIGTSNAAITMNGSTTGGLRGTSITLTCLNATTWLASGVVAGSGTLANPFAAS